MNANKINWVLDPTHSEITFKVKHLMISNVKGEFRNFEASILGEDFNTAPIVAYIKADSIFTNNEDRDNHLKSADFFESEKYPELIFKSLSFEKTDDDEYELTGNLSIKGVTKKVKLQVEYGGQMTDPYGNEKIGFSFSAKINRKDFGLNWNAALESGGVLVSDEVKIAGEVQFVKTPID